jgi:hypothetical protein
MLLILGFVVWSNVQLVTGSVENVERVVIHRELIYQGLPEHFEQIIVDSPEQLNEIFDIILNTENIRFRRHQKDYLSFMHNRRFWIDIYYSSGRTERIEPTEAGQHLFRDIPYVFGVRVRGYITGRNEEIWDYVINL